MITFKLFLEKSFNSRKLKNLATYLDINSKLDSKNLISAIASSDLYGIELILFKDFDKFDLQSLAKKYGLKVTGNVEDLKSRIFNLIDIGERHPVGYISLK